MHNAARYSLLVMFVGFVGYTLLLSGMPFLGVLLVVAGLSLAGGGANAISTRSRRRRGKQDDLMSGAADLLALTRRDWRDLGIVTLLGLHLVVAGVAAFGGAE